MSSSDQPRRTRTATRCLVSLLATALLLILCEGFASLLLAWHDSSTGGALAEQSHCAYDPELGWVNRKNARVADLYGPGRNLTTNARGFRGREEVAAAIPEGRYRIVCLGDSFTLGYGVDDGNSFPAELAAREPRLETVNMGQGGYGVDQSYLWYLRDGTPLETDLLVLAFIAPDFERMLESRFQGEYPKSVLRIENGALRKPDGPLPRDWERASGSRRLRPFLSSLALGDFFERLSRRMSHGAPLATETELPYRELAELVLADLARLSRERAQAFVLVHLPLRDSRAGDPARLLAWLRPCAASLGVPLLDLSQDFARLSPGEREASFLADGHLNPWGNRWVAETLLTKLHALVPGFP